MTDRRALRVLFVCLVCIGLGQSMLFAILPPAARALGISPFRISTIFAASASIWVFVSPWWGRQSDVRGRRPIILIGLLGFGLSMALLATTIALGSAGLLSSVAVYPLLVGSRCVFALIGSGTGPASQAYIADRTSTEERAAGLALVSAAVGLGETLGPAMGAGLAVLGLVAPIYFSAALAGASAGVIWWRLPEEGPVRSADSGPPPRLGYADRRVAPFLAIGASLQAVRATTVITLALFLQDTFALTAEQAAQRAGIGFVVLASAGLFAQLVLVQRLRPMARTMIRCGVPLMVLAFGLLVVGRAFGAHLLALASLGLGLGLVRPGSAAGASLAVTAEEQGAVAGLLGGLAVLGNVFGPMLGTTLYGISPRAPYVLNCVLMGGVLVYVLASQRLREMRS